MDRRALGFGASLLALCGAVSTVGCGRSAPADRVGRPAITTDRAASAPASDAPVSLLAERGAVQVAVAHDSLRSAAAQAQLTAHAEPPADESQEPKQPAPAIVPQIEIRFAPSGPQAAPAAPAGGLKGETIKLVVPTEAAPAAGAAAKPAAPQAPKTTTLPEPSPATVSAKRELTPLVITPRQVPGGAAAPPVEGDPVTTAAKPQTPATAPVQESPAASATASAARPAPPRPEPSRPLAAAEPPRATPPRPQPITPSNNRLPEAQPARSPAMLAALVRADERVQHGIQLAERGALYAARKEFTTGLMMIAEARDAEQGTRQFSKAVTAAMLALKESRDFVRPGAGLSEADVKLLVASHKTPVLKEVDLSDMPSIVAAQRYYTFARQQLTLAAGRERVASAALFGLGKVVTASAGVNSQQLEFAGPAMALYQAALTAEPANFRASHELGVLLAKSGQLALARDLLQDSASLAPHLATFQNLALVNARLGDRQSAEAAQQRIEELRRAGHSTTTPLVQWVDPATFSSMQSSSDGLIAPPAPANSSTPPASVSGAAPAKSKDAPAPDKPTENVAKKSLTDWLPLNLRR
jgi:tetratricopeptide (TPR) repeat protein